MRKTLSISEIFLNKGLSLFNILVQGKMLYTRSEYNRLIRSNAITVNCITISVNDFMLNKSHILYNYGKNEIVIRLGNLKTIIINVI